jgi:hypothetical protein
MPEGPDRLGTRKETILSFLKLDSLFLVIMFFYV